MKHGDLTVESSRRLHRRPAKSLGAENRSGICGGGVDKCPVRHGATSPLPARLVCAINGLASAVGRSVGRGGSADDDAGATAAAAARNK